MSPRIDNSDGRCAPEVIAACPEDDEVTTRPTRPRLTTHSPAVSAEGDSESSLPTHPLAKMQVVRPRPSPDDSASEAPPDDSPAAARMLSAVAAASPAEAREQTISLGRRPATTPSVPPNRTPQLRLRVLRGVKIDAEYPIYEGQNIIGRHDDKPVDIDLIDQEPADRVWASRQHAMLTYENGLLTVEDLHSLNGTFVNRHQLFPGRRRTLSVNDILQIGTIQMKVTN